MNEDEFFARLDRLMDISARSLNVKTNGYHKAA